jgi:hypothetical protein
VINAKLKNAIAVGPRLVNVRQTGSNQRSSDKGKQSHGANPSSLRFPAFDFPAVECHGSLPFIAAKYSI